MDIFAIDDILGIIAARASPWDSKYHIKNVQISISKDGNFKTNDD